jgi:hypothetical protein
VNPLKQIPAQLYGGPLDGEELKVCGAATSLVKASAPGHGMHLYVWSLRRVRGRRVFKFHSTCNSARHA